MTMTMTTLIGLGGFFVALRYLPGPELLRGTLAGCIPVVLDALVWRWLDRRYAESVPAG